MAIFLFLNMQPWSKSEPQFVCIFETEMLCGWRPG